MKTAVPIRRGFKLSITRITKEQYDRDYEYALWEAGFNCAIRKMKQINKKSAKNKSQGE